MKNLQHKFSKWALVNGKFEFLIVKLLVKLNSRFSVVNYFGMFQEDLIADYYSRRDYRIYDIDYIDIGSNDPVVINNTWRYYLNGENGLNIDGNAELIKKYAKIRPRDLSLCAWISHQEEEKILYVSPNSHVTTLVKDHTDLAIASGWSVTYIQNTVQTVRLSTILKENNIASVKKMFIDVEGGELDVLNSFDFEMLNVGLICVEIHLTVNQRLESNAVFSYLIDNGYSCVFFESFNFYFRK
jgi:FkbM family methyltransferase